MNESQQLLGAINMLTQTVAELKTELADMKKSRNNEYLSAKHILNFEEACQYTGLSASRINKVTGKNGTREFSYFQPAGQGGERFFLRTVLENWMMSGCQPSVEDTFTRNLDSGSRKIRKAS